MAEKENRTTKPAGSMKAVAQGQTVTKGNNSGSVKTLYSSSASSRTQSSKREEKKPVSQPTSKRSEQDKQKSGTYSQSYGNRSSSSRSGSNSYSRNYDGSYKQASAGKSMYNSTWRKKADDDDDYFIRGFKDKKKREDEVDTRKLIYGLFDQAGNQIVGEALGLADFVIGTPYQKYLDRREEKFGLEDRGENFISSYNRQFQEKARAEAEDYAQNASKGEFASLINQFGPDVLALLPDLALASFSGGTNFLAKGAMTANKAVKAASKASKLDDALDIAKYLGRTVKDNPSLLGGTARTMGQSFNQALYEGADRKEASYYAALNGAIDFGLNGAGVLKGQAGLETLPGKLRQTGDSVSDAAKYGKAIVHDGFEGVGQGMAQRASRAIYDDDVKLMSEDDHSAVINPEMVFADFAMGGAGAAVASGLHAGTKALDKPANAAADRLERAYFKDHIMRGDEKLDKKTALEQADILRKLTHGQLLGNEEIHKLNMNNKEIRNLFTRETGVPLSIHDLDIKHEDVLRQKLNFAATKVRNGDAITDTDKYPLAKFSDQIYNKIATNPRSHKYKHGDWAGKEIKTENEVFNGKQLAAKATYVCGENNYIYKTDGSGRIQNATGALLLSKREREKILDNKTPGKHEGDHAGHIFADMFGGSPKLLNLISENAHVNLSDHKKVENLLQKALKNNEEVYVDYDLHYSGDGVRPDRFTITYYHGNDYGSMKPVTVVIENPEPTPKNRKRN